MINDFILTYDNIFSKDECEDYIDRINHYINAGIVFKEDYDKLHSRDHYTINFNNHDHPEFNVLAGDNLSLHFLPKIKKPISVSIQYTLIGDKSQEFESLLTVYRTRTIR